MQLKSGACIRVRTIPLAALSPSQGPSRELSRLFLISLHLQSVLLLCLFKYSLGYDLFIRYFLLVASRSDAEHLFFWIDVLCHCLLCVTANLEMNESSRWTEEEMETAKKGQNLGFF